MEEERFLRWRAEPLWCGERRGAVRWLESSLLQRRRARAAAEEPPPPPARPLEEADLLPVEDETERGRDLCAPGEFSRFCQGVIALREVKFFVTLKPNLRRWFVVASERLRSRLR